MSSERPPEPRGLDSPVTATLPAEAELGANPAPDTADTLARLDVPGLAVYRERRGSAVVVSADGEVDMTSSAALSDELDAAAGLAIDLIVVDLNAVTTQRAVLRPIQLTGLDRELALFPTVEQALTG
jgi:hypothetical protein